MLCPNCKQEVENAKFCSNCGASISMPSIATQEPPKKKRKVFKTVLTACLAIIIVSAVIGIFTQPKKPATNGSTTTTSSKQEDLELLDYDWENDGYLRYAVGHIRNNTNKTYSYVQVSINLYDGETQVGSTLDNVNNLEPGATWEFKAAVLDDKATSYKIKGITGF